MSQHGGNGTGDDPIETLRAIEIMLRPGGGQATVNVAHAVVAAWLKRIDRAHSDEPGVFKVGNSAELQLDHIREMLGIDQTVDVVEALGGYLRHLEARAWDIKADDRKVNVLVVGGVEGPSVYLDNYRIAGNKPWGGGSVLHEFNADYEHVLRALGVQDSGRSAEGGPR